MSLLDSDDYLDAVEKKCMSCCKWCNTTDKRRKPCKDKKSVNKTEDSKPCKEYDPRVLPVCKDCMFWGQRFRGKTCYERGKSETDPVCDKFKAKMDKVTVNNGAQVYCTLKGNVCVPVEVKPGGAISVILGSTVVIVEAITDSDLRVMPIAIDSVDDIMYRNIPDNRIAIGLGSVTKICVDGTLDPIDMSNIGGFTMNSTPSTKEEKLMPGHKYEPKPEHKVEKPEQPRSESKTEVKKKHRRIEPPEIYDESLDEIDRLALWFEEIKRVRKLRKSERKSEQDNSTFSHLDEDIPKITATFLDTIKNIRQHRSSGDTGVTTTPVEVLDNLVARYTRARNLTPNEANWVRTKVAAAGKVNI